MALVKEFEALTRVKLTDEEMNPITDGADCSIVLYAAPADREWFRGVAKAQLKKFVDIIKSDYPETLFLLEDLKFWRDLLEEVSYVDFNSFDM